MPAIDWTDATVQAALFGLVGFLLAAVAGYLGARAGASASVKVAKMTLTDAERVRFQADVRRLAADLLREAALYRDEVRRYVLWVSSDDAEPWPFRAMPPVRSSQPMYVAQAELGLVAVDKDTAIKAGALYSSVMALDAFGFAPEDLADADHLRQMGRDRVFDFLSAEGAYLAAAIAFTDAVRVELGRTPFGA